MEKAGGKTEDGKRRELTACRVWFGLVCYKAIYRLKEKKQVVKGGFYYLFVQNMLLTGRK